jgi:polyisoprenoid-binding protein YceI
MAWTLDPHHTSVSFSAKHLGVSTVRGHFNKVEAEVDLDDPNDPTTGRGKIVVDAASIDTDFLDVVKYPTGTFEVRFIKPAGGHINTVTGDLTIHGITKEVALDYEHGGTVTDPYGNPRVGGTLTGSINRSDWGLKWNVPLGNGGLLVSEKVRLEIDGELTQVKEAVAVGAQAEAQA